MICHTKTIIMKIFLMRFKDNMLNFNIQDSNLYTFEMSLLF